eukprot:15442539-Alexandrium_andersonii.AAC.1
MADCSASSSESQPARAKSSPRASQRVSQAGRRKHLPLLPPGNAPKLSGVVAPRAPAAPGPRARRRARGKVCRTVPAGQLPELVPRARPLRRTNASALSRLRLGW